MSPPYSLRDARRGELAGQRRAAHEERDLDAGRAQVLGGDHHLLGRLHQEPGEADRVGLVAVVRGDQVLRRHLDAQVDDPVAVVLEDDLDQVLADVVDVALHGGEHDGAAGGVLVLGHELLEVGDGGLHGLGGLEHLGHDELVVVEEAPDLLHALHERPVDDVERARLVELQRQVVEQAFLGAFHDVAREPLVQRQLDAGVLRGPRAPAEVGREGGHRVRAAPVDQVLGELALLLRDRGVALEPLAVDDRVVEAGLGALVEEDRVQHLAARGGQAEGHVRDAEDGLAARGSAP